MTLFDQYHILLYKITKTFKLILDSCCGSLPCVTEIRCKCHDCSQNLQKLPEPLHGVISQNFKHWSTAYPKLIKRSKIKVFFWAGKQSNNHIEVYKLRYCVTISCQQPGARDQLFLNKAWHRAAAIMLVETSALRLPNKPGGIAHEAFKEDSGLLQQVGCFTLCL